MIKSWSVYASFIIFQINIITASSFTYEYLRPTKYCLCVGKHFGKKPDGENFEFNDDIDIDGKSTSDPTTDLNMDQFKLRKHKLMLQSRQQQWYQPPNPLLEDPIEFVQAILVALHDSKTGALCLLQSSTTSWRRILSNSVGAPPDVTDDEVALSLQTAIERPNNQFAILTKKLDEEIIENNDFSTAVRMIQKSWNFPSDPLIFEHDDNDETNDTEKCEKIIDYCWVESRLRSPKDDELLAVVGWSLQRLHVKQGQQGYNSNESDVDAKNFAHCWFLDGIDWQDFRDEFRPGIGREEWERICG